MWIPNAHIPSNRQSMSSIHRVELSWIVAIQGDGTIRDLMIMVSYLGFEVFPYVLPFVYFCLSRTAGQRLFLLFSLTAWLLHILKLACHMPRPFWMDDRVKALSDSGGYGMPSGHVLWAVVVWPYVARTVGKYSILMVAIIIVLLVSISRVYLGVHFISDVVAAWIIGTGLIWCFEWTEQTLCSWLRSLSFWHRMLIVMWATVALLFVGFGVQGATRNVVDSFNWSTYSVGARSLSGLIQSVGELFGTACGILLAGHWASFEVRGEVWRRGFAFGYALGGAWLIRDLTNVLPSMHTETLQFLKTFLYSAVSNFWMLFLAPLLLLKARVLQAPASNVNMTACVSESRATSVRNDP